MTNLVSQTLFCGIRRVSLLCFCFLLASCGYFVTKATNDLATNLSKAVLGSNDPATVAQGLPAYLLLLDALLESNPNNTAMLAAAAELNAAYAGVFVSDPEQAAKLTSKALDYAQKNFCLRNQAACGLHNLNFEQFNTALTRFDARDIDPLYQLAATWTSWIDAHSQDWNAVAQISRAQALMLKVVELDPGYAQGNPYIYLGSLSTILPPGLGGKPEVGQEYFERAIALSQDKNLLAKVTYARRYARLMFERELHDRLLSEVIAADPSADGLTLINTLAQQEAEQLLLSADDFF